MLLPLALSSGRPDALPGQAPAAEADRILAELLVTDSLPSISVAVIRDGRLVYANAFGRADLENGAVASVQSRYTIGSVSKSITAAAVLRLASDGALRLDDTVQQHCRTFPEKPHSITIRQLLAHTSGIRHYDYRRFDADFMNRTRYPSIEAALAKFAADSLLHLPGSRYHYSSWGYVVLGCVIEGASGQRYAEYLREHLTAPSGMTATGLDEVAPITPQRVRGYYRPESGGTVNAPLFDSSDRYGAGGLLSTPSDMARFGAALLAGQLLPEPSLLLLWREASLSDGTTTGHGLGWDLGPNGTSVYHGGTSVGSTTFLYLDRADRVVVAIAVNLAIWQRDRLALAIRLASLFGEAATPPSDPPGQ